MTRTILLLLAASPLMGASAQGVPRVYEGVSASRSGIVFTMGGRLYALPHAGGDARWLRALGEGISNPVLSPTGRQVAYMRANTLWTASLDGGAPARLTWHPRASVPLAWTPKGDSVLFVSSRDGSGALRPYVVPLAGGPEHRLPFASMRFASFAPDGSSLALVERSSTPWIAIRRYYRGGNRSPLRVVDRTSGATETVPAGDVNAVFPSWNGHRLYFATDTLGAFNIAVYDTRTRDLRLLTQWRSHGITVAGGAGGFIAFVRDGQLHLLNAERETFSVVPVRIAEDTTELATRQVLASADIQAASVSAGVYAAESRGEVIVWSANAGGARNLTRSPGAAERTPVLSPDGVRVAYFSDEGGEYGLHVRNADGSGQVQRIAVGARPTYFRGLQWSPDGRRVVFSDQRLVLWMADLRDGSAVPVDSSAWIAQGVWQTAWSPDGRLLAYSKGNARGVRAIWVRDLVAGAAEQVSRPGLDDVWPQFHPSGRWLYFASSITSANASARDVWALQSDLMAQPFVSHSLMVVALRDGRPESWVSPVGGALGAVERLQMARDGSLFATVTRWPARDLLLDDATRDLVRITVAPAVRTTTVAQAIDEALVSSDRNALLIRRADEWMSATLDSAVSTPVPFALPDVAVEVRPRSEWAQIFRESFRMMRDYLYDEGLHGVDIAELERHYAAWLPGVTRRQGLNDLLELAFAEISVSHLSVSGGDTPAGADAPNDRVGLLGADVIVDNGRFRLSRVYRDAPYMSAGSGVRAPLASSTGAVNEGDYLLAVNGTPIIADRPLEAYFVGTRGVSTRLSVGPSADGVGARDLVSIPIGNDGDLRRAAWVEENRVEVERRSNGSLRYVYVGAWTFAGIAELDRAINGLADGQGLVIDQRGNGGGITPDASIASLLRSPLYRYAFRYGSGYGVPQHPVVGPVALITSGSNFSAAETFALMFKRSRVGPVVGERTGGGGVGGALFYQRLIDGGRLTIPNRAAFDPASGDWEIENGGVSPDVAVTPSLYEVDARDDTALQAAINAALSARAVRSPARPRVPEYPVHPRRDP